MPFVINKCSQYVNNLYVYICVSATTTDYHYDTYTYRLDLGKLVYTPSVLDISMLVLKEYDSGSNNVAVYHLCVLICQPH